MGVSIARPSGETEDVMDAIVYFYETAAVDEPHVAPVAPSVELVELAQAA